MKVNSLMKITKTSAPLVAIGLFSAFSSFAATVGKLPVTQALNNFSTEMETITSLICIVAITVMGWDLWRNRELGMIGGTALAAFVGSGLTMSAPYLVSMIPGAAGFTI